MARAKKLRPAAVRAIFKSTEPATKVGPKFGVSTNLVYLIRAGRIHKHVTSSLSAPVQARGRGRPPAVAGLGSLDMTKLADTIIDRLLARLSSRVGRRAASR